MRRILSLIVFSLTYINVHASSIKGYVSELKSKDPLVGATVYLKNSSFGASVGLDGSYQIKNVPHGEYTIIVSMVGYNTVEREVSVNNENVVANFQLDDNYSQLNEIVVKGIADDQSETVAKNMEFKADNVINVISSKAIQLLPDITVGNILQRVPGVSITRNSSGDGQYAIIRGMDKRYCYTLVNGVKIPSPDNKNRYVPMDIFAGDLVERLEVTKALTPSMEGDAIGGAMNIVLKEAPSKLDIHATVAGGYSNILNSQRPFSAFDVKGVATKSPAALHGANYEAKPSDFGVHQLQYSNKNLPVNSLFNLSIGNRILKDKIGFIVAGSYQNIFRGTNSLFYVPDEPAALPNPNTYLFQELQIRKFSNNQKRLGLHAKFDFDLNKSNKISLYNFYMQLDEYQHRNYYNPLGSGVATNDIHDRSKYTRQSIYNSTITGNHDFFQKKFLLEWKFAYSIAKSNTPAWSDMNVRSRYDNTGTLVSTELLPVNQRWTNNEDHDKTGYLNLAYVPRKGLEFAAGGMVRAKTRNNVYTEYELGTLQAGGNYETFNGIQNATFNFQPLTNAYANPSDPNNYTAKENITAFYAQGKYNVGRLQILGGVRNEMTLQEYHSQLTIYADGKDGKITYSDLLPSFHFKYSLSDKQNLRLSYYKAVSRPGYYEFVPIELSGDVFTEAGNYKIKHTTADNFDLRYELFPKGNQHLLAGVFYKSIKNPIEYGFVPVTVSTSYVTPQNYGPATNYGFELVVAKYIHNWGINANYTYTQSSITQAKKYKESVKLSDGSTTIVNSLKNQQRPLQGQSNHIANVSLIYKNSRYGIDAQLALVYTGRRINIVSPYKDLDYWQRGLTQLDFSMEKTFLKKFKAFAKITNLLNTPLIVEVLSPNYLSADSPGQDRKNRIVVQKDVFNQTFLVGIRYHL